MVTKTLNEKKYEPKNTALSCIQMSFTTAPTNSENP